jgi:hypothetical protein
MGLIALELSCMCARTQPVHLQVVPLSKALRGEVPTLAW